MFSPPDGMQKQFHAIIPWQHSKVHAKNTLPFIYEDQAQRKSFDLCFMTTSLVEVVMDNLYCHTHELIAMDHFYFYMYIY